MRNLHSVGAGFPTALAEFNSRIPSPATSSALASPPKPTTDSCDPHKCPWWPYTNAKDFKANTALILVILCCTLICALAFNAGVRYFILSHCNRRREKAETGGAAAEQAAEIPALIYSEGTKLAGAETECIICLSEFTVGDKIRVLDRCSHGFHLQCVQQWLDTHSSCPTCRANCSIESNSLPP